MALQLLRGFWARIFGSLLISEITNGVKHQAIILLLKHNARLALCF